MKDLHHHRVPLATIVSKGKVYNNTATKDGKSVFLYYRLNRGYFALVLGFKIKELKSTSQKCHLTLNVSELYIITKLSRDVG